jgi:hypothetical protein
MHTNMLEIIYHPRSGAIQAEIMVLPSDTNYFLLILTCLPVPPLARTIVVGLRELVSGTKDYIR